MAEAQVFFDNPVTGKRQFDQTFKNLHLIAKGTAEAALSAGGSVGLRYVDLTFNNCKTPLLAIHNPNKAVAWYRHSVNGSTWVWRVFSNNASGVFEYYLFDTNPPALNMGFELRNAAQEITFSLGHRPQRVVARLLDTPNSSTTYAIGSGQKLACAPMRSGFSYNQSPGPGGTTVLVATAVQGALLVSGGIRTEMIATDAREYTSNNPPPVNPPTATGADWLIMDVTNY